mgnify:FL=1
MSTTGKGVGDVGNALRQMKRQGRNSFPLFNTQTERVFNTRNSFRSIDGLGQSFIKQTEYLTISFNKKTL